MGMQLVVANDLETLADRLVEHLSDSPNDPFTPESIVVPGDGVRSWLTHAIATRIGICSNINFAYPAKFLKTVFNLESKLGLWETGPLTWAIHAIQKEDGIDDLLRARAIADVFDRYILYRPHMVRRWSDGENVDGALQALADHQQWQPELWRKLEAELGNQMLETLMTSPNALQTILLRMGPCPSVFSYLGCRRCPNLNLISSGCCRQLSRSSSLPQPRQRLGGSLCVQV